MACRSSQRNVPAAGPREGTVLRDRLQRCRRINLRLPHFILTASCRPGPSTDLVLWQGRDCLPPPLRLREPCAHDPRPTRPTALRYDRGIAFMLASMAIFVVNDTLMKIAAGHLPTGQAIFVRGLLTSVLGATMIAASGAHRALPYAALRARPLACGCRCRGHHFLPQRSRAHAHGRLVWHPAVHPAGRDCRSRAVHGSQGRLAALGGHLRRPSRCAHHRAPGRLGVRFPRHCWRFSRFCSLHSAISSPAACQPRCRPLIIVTVGSAVVTLASLGFTAVETWRWPQNSTLLILFGASGALLAGQAWLVAAMRTGHIWRRCTLPLFDGPMGHRCRLRCLG